MLENLSLATFTELLQSDFRIRTSGDQPAVAVKLVQADDRGSTPHQEQFAILFHGPLELALRQGLYQMEQEQLGSFDLFIVPVGRDARGYQYEAIFNRVR
jgi:hypothetical protein